MAYQVATIKQSKVWQAWADTEFIDDEIESPRSLACLNDDCHLRHNCYLSVPENHERRQAFLMGRLFSFFKYEPVDGKCDHQREIYEGN